MSEATTELTWGGLLRSMGRWLKENLPRALLMSAISFAFGWLVNFWVMAFRWDGFRAPTGQSDYITAQDSILAGTLFWTALASFLFAVVSYGFRVGWGQLVSEVFGLPHRIGSMFRGDERTRSLTSLLWALMLGLLLSMVISPGVGAIAAGFFIAFAATPLGDLLTGVLRRLWIQLVARFAPHKGEPSSEVGSAAVTAAGMLVGFLVAVAVDFLALKILALVMAGLADYYFANEDDLGPSGGTAVLLLIAGAAGLYELFDGGIALADDGGWSECGNCNVFDYITSTGAAEVVSRSTVAGGGAAVGAPVGAAVGDVLGTMGGGPGGGGGTGGGSTAGPTADQGAATGDRGATTGDQGDILGAIGGGEGAGGATTGVEAGGPAPGESGDAGGQVRTAGHDVTAAPDGQDATEDTAAADDGDILGAIGGGEGGAATAGGAAAGDVATADGAEAGTEGDPAADAVTRRTRRTGPDAPPPKPDPADKADSGGPPPPEPPPPPKPPPKDKPGR